MSHYKYLHRKSFIKDALWLIAINGVLLVFFASYDVFEALVVFVAQHESWELDELLPLSATLTISLLIFAYRRMKELGEVTYAFEELSKLDPLTKVFNRRSGHVALASFINRAEVHQQGFSLLQINLDNFKKINDLYGASVGDEILIKVARALAASTPKNTKLVRWHSDTFLIILPAGKQSPFEVASQLCCNVSENIFASVDPITCSIGVALWQRGVKAEQLLNEAEDALFLAKTSGKNQVKVA